MCSMFDYVLTQNAHNGSEKRWEKKTIKYLARITIEKKWNEHKFVSVDA